MSDLTFSEPQSQIDHFDRLPDSILLLTFNKIGDFKALGRCLAVSRRFHSSALQFYNVVVRVSRFIYDDDSSSSSLSAPAISSSSDRFRNLFRFVFGRIVKPLQRFTQCLNLKRPALSSSASSAPSLSDAEHGGGGGDGVTYHSLTQVLKIFKELRFLRIELLSGELGLEDGVLLKWRADFGSTLDNCVILGASAVFRSPPYAAAADAAAFGTSTGEDYGSIPESFYTNGDLKLRVDWTTCSLDAASGRHYLLEPIILEHKTLENLVVTDADGQGVLCMNRELLEELRRRPVFASSPTSKRTLVPDLDQRLWYEPHLELPDGMVLKGATLVAIRLGDQSLPAMRKKEVSSWVSSAFEEPYGTAAKMLVMRRTYCPEMNSILNSHFHRE